MLIASESRGRSALQRILATTGVTVDPRTEEQVMREGLGDARLAVLQYDGSKPSSSAVLAELSQNPSCPVIVTLPSSQKGDLVRLFSYAAVTNIIPDASDAFSNELIVTAQKILKNDIFGFEKYLTWGLPRHDYLVHNTTQYHGVMRELSRYLHGLGVNSRLIALACGVADELFMNALQSAPGDDDVRGRDVELAPEQAVVCTFTCDGRYLGLCVTDPFGRLELTTVRDYLRKCFAGGPNQVDTKLRGGGLGFYTAFQSLNHLVINIAPGRSTEIIGLLDISGSYRDYALQPKSFNVFVYNGETR